MGSPDKIRVRFSVEDDEQAAKITALLQALGYVVVRDLDQGTPQDRLRWAVIRLAKQARLTEREGDVLECVLRGLLNDQIGEQLGIRKATVKWHMHNIFTKCRAGSREELLREALQLGLPDRERKPEPEPEAEPEAEAEAKAKASAEEPTPAPAEPEQAANEDIPSAPEPGRAHAPTLAALRRDER